MSDIQKRFEELQANGKMLAAQGRLKESLKKFEEARNIKETPKIVQRIEKLKLHIEKTRSNSGSVSSYSLGDETMKLSKEHISPPTSNLAPTEIFLKPQVPKALVEIQNKEVIANTHALPNSPLELSPEALRNFNELKKSAMEMMYEGNFDGAQEAFTKALKICNCPKIQKYIKEVEAVNSKHTDKLQMFKNLTNTGKKLASEGRSNEGLKKLKEAFAVCPSPKVSKMIKLFEVEKQESPLSDDVFESSVKGSSSESMTAQAQKPKEPVFKATPFQTPREDDFQTSRHQNSAESVKDPSELSPSRLSEFKRLYSSAREDAAAGNLELALDSLKKAKGICPSDKVLKRIKDLTEIIKKSSSELDEEEECEMIAVAEDFYVFHEIHKKLYPYQRAGVAWMWDLYRRKKGGVLGDDMGLGKTFQVIAFLSGMIDADRAKHILIIMPVSLLPNWEREFKKWCPGISVHTFHSGSKKERERNALRVQRRGHVLLTSYGMILSNLPMLTGCEGRQFVWDYVILDEGHKIKNPTKTTKAVHEIPSRNRLVLTGTPVQNNLKELWSLYDFVHQGTLLGSLKTFKMQYENPITRSREKDATAGEKRLGTQMAESLKMLIKPYFLRRTKAEIWDPKASKAEEVDSLNRSMNQLKLENKLTSRKNDLIVWICMSAAQIDIYKNFLHSEAVRAILVSKRSPLVELTVLKKICDHPRLLSRRACSQLGLGGQEYDEDLDMDDQSGYASSIENVTDESLITESGKMKFLIELLENLKETGHRTLVFSLSRKILDMIHRILTNKKWKVMRIDGTVSKIDERERRIQQFQKDPSYPVFLLTTQVGGVGITLTAADRVVIYDPSWNPATDAQAVDRVYRIGQQRNVVVYRLITCGTVEEKIYRRQIFKDSITKQTTCDSDPYRYFSKQELRELFSLDDPTTSATQIQLSRLHSNERESDVSLDEHIAFLYSRGIFGISDHDLMFTKNIKDHTEDHDDNVSMDYINKQVEVAQKLISAEAFVVEEGMKMAGTFTKPYTELIPTYKKITDKDQYKPPSFPEFRDLETKEDSVKQPNRPKSDPSFSEYVDLESKEDNFKSPKIDPSLPEIVDLEANEEDFKKPFRPIFNAFRTPSKADVVDLTMDECRSGPSKDWRSVSPETSIYDTTFEPAHSSSKFRHKSSTPIRNKDESYKLERYTTDFENTKADDTKVDISNASFHTPSHVSRSEAEKKRDVIEIIDDDISHNNDVSRGQKSENHTEFDRLVAEGSDDEYEEEIRRSFSTLIGDDFSDEKPENGSNRSRLDLTSSKASGSVLEDGQERTDKSNRSRLSLSSNKASGSVLEDGQERTDNKSNRSRLGLSLGKATVAVNVLDQDNDIDEGMHENAAGDVPSSIETDEVVETDEDIHSDDENEYKATSGSRFLNEQSLRKDASASEGSNEPFLNDQSGNSVPMEMDIPGEIGDLDEVPTPITSSTMFDFLDDEHLPTRKSRRSCARPSQLFVVDSDSSSQPSAPSTANNSEDEILASSEDESEEDNASLSAESNESSSASLTYIPSSIPNSPYRANNVTEIPPSPYQQHVSRRITPLRLRKSMALQPNEAFARALATSPVVNLNYSTYETAQEFPKKETRRQQLSSSEDDDDEVPVFKKTKHRAISSDSDE